MRLNRNFIRNNIKIQGEYVSQADGIIQPAVCTGLENATYTLFFNDLTFSNETIEVLISTLEDVKISGSYSRVDIYISSVGGLANQLILFADYLNSYPLDINFKVHGEASSCGAIILLMVKNATIEYLPTARAMLHLGHQRIHSSTSYNYKPNLDGNSSDLEGLKELNDYIWDNYYSKLNLEEEELDALKKGQDVFLNRERMEEVYEAFKDRQYFEEDFDDTINEIDRNIEALKNEEKRLEDIKNEMFADYEKFLEEYGEYNPLVEEKIGGTD